MRRLIKALVVTVLIASVLTACKKPDKNVVFRRIDNIRVNELRGTKVHLVAEAVFNNPNDVKMNLKEADIDVYLDGKKVASLQQTFKVKIPKMSDFKVPVDVRFDLKSSGVINGLLSLINGKKRELEYKGEIKVGIHGVTIKAPVEYKAKVGFR
ncbi:MAG: LEA type 2 family protein [Bacteroidota bacterium]